MALAASEFFSGILQNKLESNDELRVQTIQASMEKILQALLECCVMSDADRMGDMPTKEQDINSVDAKRLNECDDADEEVSNESEEDNYTTLRKSCAFTLQ